MIFEYADGYTQRMQFECFEFSSAGFQSSPRDRVPFCKGRLKNQTTTQQVGKTLLETLNASSEGIPPQL